MVKKPEKKSWFRNIFKGDDTPTEQMTKYVIVHRNPIGSSGVENYAGYTSEEYLDALQGRQRADIFDKMRRSDSQIKMLTSAIKNTIKGAIFDIEPAEGFKDEQWAKDDAEMMKYILFEGLDCGFKQFVAEALSMIDFGHSVFEMIDQVTFDHPKFGTLNTLKDLSWRSPRTIERWNLDPVTGKLCSITQNANGDLQRYVDIPAIFMVVFSIDREGSNYEGISMLRSVYGNWFRKNVYMKLNAIGVEKHAIPTAIATVPDAKEGTPEFENLVAALEAYTSHEKGYIIKPTGWEIDLETNTYDPQKVEFSVDSEDKRMAKAFLANFLELGMNGFGSQSLSVDLSDFFLAGLDCVADIICDQMNRVVIPRMVQLNRGARPGYPMMKQSGISDRVGIELADILQKMFSTKGIIPDGPLEAHLRKRFGLPEKSSEDVRNVDPPQQYPSATPKLSERLKRIRRRG